MTITPHELATAARPHLQRGITPEQAIILGFADLTGEPLDPHRADDAAVLLRAERLLRDCGSVRDALATAHNERATFTCA